MQYSDLTIKTLEPEELKDSQLQAASFAEDQGEFFQHLSHLSVLNRETSKYQQVNQEDNLDYDIKFMDPANVINGTSDQPSSAKP